MAATEKNTAADNFIAVSGKIEINTTKRVPLISTDLDVDFFSSGLSLVFYENRGQSFSRKAMRFGFKSDIKTGTYKIEEDNAFVSATYFEHLNTIDEQRPEDYVATEGSLTIIVTGEGTAERSYTVTAFKLTVKSTFSGKTRVLDGSFTCYIEDVLPA